MVQPLVRLQVHRVEHLVDPLPFRPVEVPVRIRIGLLPAARRHHIINRVREGRPELDGRAAAGHLDGFVVVSLLLQRGGWRAWSARARGGCLAAFGLIAL